MQIVIDIPDAPIKDYQDLYFKIYGMAASEGLFDDRIKSQRALALKVVLDILGGIVDGTPLPKGHGRLIDADALNRKDVNCANVPMNFIDTAQTIIEADKSAIEDAIIEEAEEYEADLDN